MTKLTPDNDLFEAYKLKYNAAVPAAALFFHERHYALRVEVPALGKEFAYGVYIGTDPEGYFYYNDTSELDKPTRFKVFQVNNPLDSDQTPCAKIEFWHKDHSQATDPYAVFLGADPTRVVTKTGFDNFDSLDHQDPYAGGKGPAWVDLKLAWLSATVRKARHDTHVTLITDVINKQATWTVNADYFPFGTRIHSRGTLSCKSLAHLNTAMAGTVDYSEDRIVFYNGRNAQDFVAFFIPFQSITSDGHASRKNTLGRVREKEFSGVHWHGKDRAMLNSDEDIEKDPRS